MPRSLTPRAVIEAQRVSSDDVFLVLMTTYMAGTSPDIRLVNNVEDLVSRGQSFIGCPFRITLAEESAESRSSPVSLELDNVDPRIWQGLRALTFPPSILIEVVLASEPDNVILATPLLKLRSAEATTTTISISLLPESVWDTGFPEGDFDPAQNPGLFA